MWRGVVVSGWHQGPGGGAIYHRHGRQQRTGRGRAGGRRPSSFASLSYRVCRYPGLDRDTKHRLALQRVQQVSRYPQYDIIGIQRRPCRAALEDEFARPENENRIASLPEYRRKLGTDRVSRDVSRHKASRHGCIGLADGGESLAQSLSVPGRPTQSAAGRGSSGSPPVDSDWRAWGASRLVGMIDVAATSATRMHSDGSARCSRRIAVTEERWGRNSSGKRASPN